MIDTLPWRRWSTWFWIGLIWSAGGLFDASQTVLIMHAEGNHHPWPPLFTIEFASWLPWALATPWVVGLARRYPVDRKVTVVVAAVHIAAFVAISALAEAWNAGFQVAFDPWGHRRPPTFVNTWSTNLLYQVLTFVIAYVLILTVTYALASRERLARELTESARLNEELSKAQLAALRRQMEPHFMFNTLNSIAGLVRDQRSDAAVSMLVGLSEFLRRASDDSHRAQVSLGEEVEYLERYIAIQKVRFGERLQLEVDVPADLLRAQVPNLLLQPLVENAIKHGVSQRVAGGAVRIDGVREGETLRLRVRNDAPITPSVPSSGRAGVGLENLRTRMQILHGAAADLTLRRCSPAEVEVLVTLPFQEA